MKNITLLISFLIGISTLAFADDKPDFSMTGFVTLNGATTGGNAAGENNIIDVYTTAELQTAIGGEKTTTPRIIRVNGTLTGGEIAIKNCANLTIFGAEDGNAFIEQCPIIITNSSNIIIRNIKFTMVGKTGGKDIMEITTTSSSKSQNIWIDHCEFYNETPTAAGAESGSIKDRYDGLLDIKKGSEYITISWCYFHDHYKAILVGYTTADTQDRKITMHHNRFEKINSRVPSYRGGTAHIYNNYFEGWIENGISYGNMIHTREGCNLLVENNFFTKLSRGVYWEPADANEGFATGTGNYFDSTVKSGFTSAAGTSPFTPPYNNVYQDAAENIPDITLNYAGVGIINAYDDYGGDIKTGIPTVNITSPSAGAEYDAPADVTVEAEVTDEDGTITKVEFYKNGELFETLTSAPYSYTFTNLMAGSYSFTVKGYDNDDNFGSKAVSVTVKKPTLEIGESIFGSAAPSNDYFWFDENQAKVTDLMTDGTISGNISFNPAVDVSYTTHKAAIVVAKEGGSVVFKLPSCTVFKLYFTRTGSFGGKVYVSTDGINWGDAVASLSGSSGAKEVDYSDLATLATEVHVKIENTSTGGLNIHGANIRKAKGDTSSVGDNQLNKTVVNTRYYTLSGMMISQPIERAFYIKEEVYNDGTSNRTKIFHNGI